MNTIPSRMDDYAKLIVEVGINAQPGEPVVISCPVEGAPFARALAKHAYSRGADEVVVNWFDDDLTLMKYKNSPIQIFETFPDWIFQRTKHYYERHASVISVHATDPELLKDVLPAKIAAQSKSQSIAMEPLKHYTMNDILSWCVVSIPTASWASLVFPELNEKEGVAKLWKTIFDVTRMNEPDPVTAWQTHRDTLNAKTDVLNEKNILRLHYRSKNGTDLTVELPELHLWVSADSTNCKGHSFIPNIPTEEVFTVPKRTGVNGTLVSTKPLNYGGNLIDGMRFTFVAGKVVEYSANEGHRYLKDMFSIDDNGLYLGEVALVPYHSPISQSGILFYNTLFDENASCHFAFGAAYPTNLKGGENMTKEERLEHGANDSLIHVDFMVGAPDLSIVASTADNESFPVFVDGDWAF